MKKRESLKRPPGAARRGPAPPPPPTRDWPVAAVALVALAISVYLGVLKLAGSAPLFCEAESGCDIVQSSRYAVFLGVPTALWGAALYAAVAVLALVGLTVQRWLAAFVLAVVAVSFSGYLTYLELAVIHAICKYCAVVAGLAVIMLVLLVVRRPAATGRRSPTRPGRLVAVGGAVAVVTLFVAVGVFSGGSASSSSGYQEALARHLKASGAIFYGAFW
jgi:uncharacterized membrane protein